MAKRDFLYEISNLRYIMHTFYFKTIRCFTVYNSICIFLNQILIELLSGRIKLRIFITFINFYKQSLVSYKSGILNADISQLHLLVLAY